MQHENIKQSPVTAGSARRYGGRTVVMAGRPRHYYRADPVTAGSARRYGGRTVVMAGRPRHYYRADPAPTVINYQIHNSP
ncbi:hypothetical protein LK449_14765 [Parabacteroides johnsonii]|uniref:hypothetical protein n=1 Tax=Parabacteroides johnsonii TaxID=387661 RepID=UPI001D14639D|nr:hypothetical protein [Parabacteroides johnsonii]UEA89792.1 hypothetical protein LK449_14765 [Parabacteroides johnsonii]